MPRLLQLNTRSINTSQKLLKLYARSKHTDIISLSEIWTPKDLKPLTSNYTPHIRLRSKDNPTETHGGVAIFSKPSIKSIPDVKLEISNLEACWVNTYIQGTQLTIGSIYIPPGELDKLPLLDKALQMLENVKNVMITGDLNSRHLYWERWHQSIPDRTSEAWEMGDKLLEILDKHGYTVLNNGQYTRSQDRTFSALDITAVKGTKLKFTWQVDHAAHLSSDHHPILINIGRTDNIKKKVKDLKKQPHNQNHRYSQISHQRKNHMQALKITLHTRASRTTETGKLSSQEILYKVRPKQLSQVQGSRRKIQRT